MLFRLFKNNDGQALTEMLLVIPLLILMLAGTIQLTLLFQAKVAFDKACGDIAREYAAGTVNDTETFRNELWVHLGSYQPSFTRNSLSVSAQTPKPSLIDKILQKIDAAGPIASKLRSYLINYDGRTWTVRINYIPQFTPAFVIPNGLSFQNQFSVLRYPF